METSFISKNVIKYLPCKNDALKRLCKTPSLRLQLTRKCRAYEFCKFISLYFTKPFNFNTNASGVFKNIKFLDTNPNRVHTLVIKAHTGDAFCKGLNQIDMPLIGDGEDTVRHGLVTNDVQDIVDDGVLPLVNGKV